MVPQRSLRPRLILVWAVALEAAAMTLSGATAGKTARRDCVDGGPYDLVIAIDSSASIRRSDFAKQLAFVRDFVGLFDVASNRTRVGVVSYGASYHLNFDLSLHRTSADVQAAIQKIKQVGRGTSTNKVLEFVRGHMFTPAAGERPEARDLCLLITDGKSTYAEETRLQARLAQQKGLEIHVVGVGERVDDAELHAIAGGRGGVGRDGRGGRGSRIYYVPSFDHIHSVLEQFKDRHSCERVGLLANRHAIEGHPSGPVSSGTTISLLCRTEFPLITWFIGGIKALSNNVSSTNQLYESAHALVAVDPVTNVQCSAEDFSGSVIITDEVNVTTIPAAPIIIGEPREAVREGTLVTLLAASFGRDPETKVIWYADGRAIDATFQTRSLTVENELSVMAPLGRAVYEARVLNPRMSGYLSAKATVKAYECDLRKVPADIVMAFDASSGSLDKIFRRTVEAAAGLVDQFAVDPSMQRVGAFVYSDVPQAWFHLDDYSSRSTIQRALRAEIRLEPGCADADSALRFANEVMFEPSDAARERRRALIFFTSGESSAFVNVSGESREMAFAGVEIFAVAMGDTAAEEHLTEVTGSRSRVVTSSCSDYDGLEKKFSEMISQCPTFSATARGGSHGLERAPPPQKERFGPGGTEGLVSTVESPASTRRKDECGTSSERRAARLAGESACGAPRCAERRCCGPRHDRETYGRQADAGRFVVYSDDMPKKDWSNWSFVTGCSVTCGRGVQRISRKCLSPSACRMGAVQYKDRPCSRRPCAEQYCGGQFGVDLLVIASSENCGVSEGNGANVLRVVEDIMAALPGGGKLRVALTTDRCAEAKSKGFPMRPWTRSEHTLSGRALANETGFAAEDLDSLIARARLDSGVVPWPAHAGYREDGDSLPPARKVATIVTGRLSREWLLASNETGQLMMAGYEVLFVANQLVGVEVATTVLDFRDGTKYFLLAGEEKVDAIIFRLIREICDYK